MNKDRKITIFICIFAILFGITIRFLPNLYFEIGKNALNKKDYITAYKNLKNAYSINKNNKDYRYYYVQSLLNLTPNMTVQKELFEISSSSQNDSAQALAESKISEWKRNILNNIGDNYIEQTPMDRRIIRWSKFPIKYIITNQNNINIPQYYNEEIIKAFSQWQNSTGFIKFEQTQNISDASIIVKISQIPSNICSDGTCRYIVGFTAPNIKGNILKDMTITLYATDPNNNFFSDKELFNTVLHEIGHALGIMGHSYSSEDLMYMATEGNNFYTPYRSSFQYLSSKDINTIELLYKLIPTITDSELSSTDGLIYAPIVLGTSKDIASRKLREAQNYVKKAPAIANGYIDLGIAYTELNKPKDALKAFQKAYNLSNTNDEKYIALFNLSLASLNTKQYTTALTYAQQAKEINNTEEIQDLISEINHKKILKK